MLRYGMGVVVSALLISNLGFAAGVQEVNPFDEWREAFQEAKVPSANEAKDLFSKERVYECYSATWDVGAKVPEILLKFRYVSKTVIMRSPSQKNAVILLWSKDKKQLYHSLAGTGYGFLRVSNEKDSPSIVLEYVAKQKHPDDEHHDPISTTEGSVDSYVVCYKL